MTPPLIQRPDQVGTGRRAMLAGVTAAAWGLYVYLWLPFITLVAWFVGFRTAHTRLYLEQSTPDPFLLLALPVVALLCGLLLIGWAEYNRARFSGPERRQPPEAVDEQAVAERMHASGALAGELRTARIAVLTMDEDARPVAAASRPVPMASGRTAQ